MAFPLEQCQASEDLPSSVIMTMLWRSGFSAVPATQFYLPKEVSCEEYYESGRYDLILRVSGQIIGRPG